MGTVFTQVREAVRYSSAGQLSAADLNILCQFAERYCNAVDPERPSAYLSSGIHEEKRRLEGQYGVGNVEDVIEAVRDVQERATSRS